LFAPAGVWGVISRVFDITLFPVRRRLIVPRAIADRNENNS
jgi:hypothetical protein